MAGKQTVQHFGYLHFVACGDKQKEKGRQRYIA